jgi:hypothetical protein
MQHGRGTFALFCCPLFSLAKAQGNLCPMATNTTDTENESDQVPTVAEYKKLKRVMGMITKFYQDGTALKKSHFEQITGEIAKLDVDLGMVKEQKAVLTDTPAFVGHPKQKEYIKELDKEVVHLEGQRAQFVAKQKEYEELYKWSEGIVRVCEWLMLNLDEYCHNTIGYPEQVASVPALDEETARAYSRGLDEITHNLHESQDFFAVSLLLF